jgi:SNF2 family DNA or RNA helicase
LSREVAPVFERFLGFLNVPPFEIQYRKDMEWGGMEYRVIAKGKDFHNTIPDAGWKEYEGGCRFSTSTIPPSELFIATDSLLSARERVSWKKVYEIFSSLPRILFRQNEGMSSVTVKCGYHDTFFREMMKTHMGARWVPDTKTWSVYPPDKKCRSSFLAALEIFSRSRRRLLLGNTGNLSDIPMELMKHQSYVHELLRSAGAGGRRAFLIAHDMGLGKTYTSLTAVRSFLETSDGARGAMAIVPPATMGQWRKCALETGLSSVLYHSSNRKWESLADSDLAGADVIITGLSFLKESPDRLEKMVRMSERRMCVLDEATLCKNRNSANYKSMVPFSLSSEFMLFLSGTPILNSIGEMENLILLGDPRYYPYREFRDNHVKEEDVEIYNPAKKRRITIKKTSYLNEDGFRKRAEFFFDRETKRGTSLGIVLPNVNETKLLIDPGPVELRICRMLRREYEDFYMQSLDEDETLMQLASGHHSKSGVVLVFEQMAVNAPETLFESKGESPVLANVVERMRGEKLVPEGYMPAKMSALLDILSGEASSEAPSVVFTGFKSTARVLKAQIEEAFPGRPVYLVVGGTSSGRKAKVLDELSRTENGIIICTDALTYGVEMQFASTLVQYDLPWSPMVADQRTDRINRIGASGTRNIYYMTTRGTVEESKWKAHEKKRKTAQTVLRDEERNIQQEFAFDI